MVRGGDGYGTPGWDKTYVQERWVAARCVYDCVPRLLLLALPEQFDELPERAHIYDDEVDPVAGSALGRVIKQAGHRAFQ